MLDTAQHKLGEIRTDLRRQVLEQDEVIDLLLVAFLMRDHIAIVGPHGEGKTYLAERFARYMDGGYFYHLLTRYTVPDELIGHYSLAALQRDEFKRRTDGRACDARTVCLDEVFKANSPTLNALLGLMNERRVDGVDAKLCTLIGISNEFPRGIESRDRLGDDESLLPLWDRFVVRVELRPPTSDDTFERIVRNSLPQPTAPALTTDEVDALHARVAELQAELPDAVLDTFLSMRQRLAGEGISVSSRRWYKASCAVCAHALLHGRERATRGDCRVLRHVLWEQPEHRSKVSDIVLECASPETAVALAIEAAVLRSVHDYHAHHMSEGADKSYARDRLLADVRAHLHELQDVADDPDTSDTDEVKRVLGVLRTVGDVLKREIMEILS